MRKVILSTLLMAGLAMTGCTEHDQKHIGNDEIISESKKCHDAGLESMTFSCNWCGRAIGVECVPVKR